MERYELSEARIYVGTYAKYNKGSLQGEWVELSDFYDLDDFLERCAEIHKDEDNPEYMFQSWEAIPEELISESRLDEAFFCLRDEMDRVHGKEKDAFWVWAEGESISLTEDTYDLVKSFQYAYMGSYASKEDFAKDFVKMEMELPEFALIYFDYAKYSNDLFCTDFWYEDGYVFRNE